MKSIEDITNILDAMDIPYAYDHFTEGEAVDPPFICYLEANSNNFSADGIPYAKFSEFHIELYTDLKSPDTEEIVEAALDAASIFYEKSETWIESEKLYEVLYSFEI